MKSPKDPSTILTSRTSPVANQRKFQRADLGRGMNKMVLTLSLPPLLTIKTTLLMSRKEEEPRPEKRRRMEMPIADGFTSTAPPKPVYRPSVPHFFSAFEFDSGSSSTRTVEPDRPSTHRSDVDPFALKQPARRNTDKKHALFATSLYKDFLPASSKQNKELRRPPPPPSVASTLHQLQAASRKEFFVDENPVKFKSIRLAPEPPPLLALSSNSRVATTPLKQIVVPSFPNPNLKTPSKALQPMQQPNIAPAPPKNTVTGVKDLRSISRAEFGLLNDLSSGNAEELLGILLKDQHPEIQANEGHSDHTLHCGLELSPEKKGKGNNPKFLRGGLAMRASSLFNHSTTSLILWQKEVAHRSNGLRPDICASVIKVVHKPLPSRPTPKAATYPPAIALCRLRAPGGAVHPAYKPDHLYRIVFSFDVPNLSCSSLEHFSVGQTIHVFKPWQEVSLNDEDADSNQPRLPASWPMPFSFSLPTPDPLDATLDDTALFCSRFLIS